MINPFTLPPDGEAQKAAKEVIERVHDYMHAHPESELHRVGKMFGVLVVESQELRAESYLAAFSAKLDGSYYHEGFVPPVYEMEQEPVGKSREESRRLQRLLFANYQFINGLGERKSALEIFAKEKEIVPFEQWFGESRAESLKEDTLPPSGAGECCGPKLLQYALTHGMKPISMAEFWVGAAPKSEIRQEGSFYAPCSGKCVPILRHMLKGIDVEQSPENKRIEELCCQIDIIYEDEWLMVVNKPSGLLSVPGKNGELSIESYLRFKIEDLRFLKAVHRLDQDTSGLLVLAKTEDAYKELQAYFQRRDILKRYEAVLEPMENGKCKMENYEPGQEGIISLPLLPNPYDRPRQMIDLKHGKMAVTRYVIREKRDDGTIFVDFYPQTGRTHQLRVHAAHPDGLNAPIVGDRLYNGNYKEGQILQLKAVEISFQHPVNKDIMHFEI